jgi:hypothetical protein
VLRDSVEIRDQAGLDRLSGCERLVGALTLYAFEGMDETPLRSLRGVDGSVSVEGDSGFSVADPLAGFRSLEEVGALKVSGIPRLSLEGLESATVSGGLQLSGVAQLIAPAGAPHLGRDVWLEIDASPELRDLQAFAGVTALRALRLYQTGIENLDALSSMVELSMLDLYDNARLQQIDGLAGVQRVTQARISENPALTSLAGLAALRQVGGLQVEHNSALVELALPLLSEAGIIVVHRNATLDDTTLASMVRLPAPAVVKIASNGSGPSRLDPCPWSGDGVCDEALGDCASGSDMADCRAPGP